MDAHAAAVDQLAGRTVGDSMSDLQTMIDELDSLNRWVSTHRLSRWEMCEVLRETTYPAWRGVVLEIGCHVGDSLAIWRECHRPSLLVGVQDTDELTVERSHALSVVRVVGRSQDAETHRRVLAALNGRVVDFLYIDGDHTYDAVRADWRLYSPLVRRGGVAVLHDAVLQGNDTVDVYRFWPEISARYRTKLIHDPTVPSTGAGVVFL